MRGNDGGVLVERLEELQLGGEVSLSCFVEVEVVVGEAGEDSDLGVDLVCPVEFEGVGANFEHGVGVAGGDHLGELGLDDVGLGCGFAGFVAGPFAADMELDPVEQAGWVSRCAEHGVGEVGGGGLAVSTGDSDNCQFSRRVVVEGGGDPGQRKAGVVDADNGDFWIRVGDWLPELPSVCLDDESGCSVGNG